MKISYIFIDLILYLLIVVNGIPIPKEDYKQTIEKYISDITASTECGGGGSSDRVGDLLSINEFDYLSRPSLISACGTYQDIEQAGICSVLLLKLTQICSNGTYTTKLNHALDAAVHMVNAQFEKENEDKILQTVQNSVNLGPIDKDVCDVGSPVRIACLFLWQINMGLNKTTTTSTSGSASKLTTVSKDEPAVSKEGGISAPNDEAGPDDSGGGTAGAGGVTSDAATHHGGSTGNSPTGKDGTDSNVNTDEDSGIGKDNGAGGGSTGEDRGTGEDDGAGVITDERGGTGGTSTDQHGGTGNSGTATGGDTGADGTATGSDTGGAATGKGGGTSAGGTATSGSGGTDGTGTGGTATGITVTGGASTGKGGGTSTGGTATAGSGGTDGTGTGGTLTGGAATGTSTSGTANVGSGGTGGTSTGGTATGGATTGGGTAAGGPASGGTAPGGPATGGPAVGGPAAGGPAAVGPAAGGDNGAGGISTEEGSSTGTGGNTVHEPQSYKPNNFDTSSLLTSPLCSEDVMRNFYFNSEDQDPSPFNAACKYTQNQAALTICQSAFDTLMEYCFDIKYTKFAKFVDGWTNLDPTKPVKSEEGLCYYAMQGIVEPKPKCEVCSTNHPALRHVCYMLNFLNYYMAEKTTDAANNQVDNTVSKSGEVDEKTNTVNGEAGTEEETKKEDNVHDDDETTGEKSSTKQETLDDKTDVHNGKSTETGGSEGDDKGEGERSDSDVGDDKGEEEKSDSDVGFPLEDSESSEDENSEGGFGDQKMKIEEQESYNNQQEPNKKTFIYKNHKFEEEEASSHFLAYSLTAIILILATYIAYHNKHKIIAVIIEGRNGRGNGRRGGSYRRLNQNVSS